MTGLFRFLAVIPVCTVSAAAQGVGDQAVFEDDWTRRKCALYRQATQDATTALGVSGLRPEFLYENETFIKEGCVTYTQICARTPEEFAFADLLTMMTMNEGMASTFVPFGCQD